MHIKTMKELPYSVNSLEVNSLKEERRVSGLLVRKYYYLQEDKISFF